MNYRPFVQVVTLALCLFALAIMILVRIKSGTYPRSLYGVTALAVHHVIFYIFVLLASLGSCSILDLANQFLGTNILTFSLWSSALRLQTSMELLFMSLTVYRRYAWTQGV